MSPPELVPPNTLHTDRPYISSSTWTQAAPACSGSTSPYAVIVRYANWVPRGWPCPAGVGGDPPFTQCIYPGAAAAACAAWRRSEDYRSTSPATQSRRFMLPPPHPLIRNVLPSIPSHMSTSTLCQTTRRAVRPLVQLGLAHFSTSLPTQSPPPHATVCPRVASSQPQRPQVFLHLFFCASFVQKL